MRNLTLAEIRWLCPTLISLLRITSQEFDRNDSITISARILDSTPADIQQTLSRHECVEALLAHLKDSNEGFKLTIYSDLYVN